MENLQDVGIVSFGLYIPEDSMSSNEVAERSGLPRKIVEEKLGFRRKPVPGPDDHPCLMAIRAALQAIQRGKVEPMSIDLVIWAGDEYKEYPLWTAGIKLQHEVGAYRAWAFDISLRCSTMIMALKVAKDMLCSDPNLRVALIASGYRNCDLIDYSNPRTRFMYSLSAGGAAVILKKGHPANRIRSFSFIMDGSFSEDVAVPAGGTKIPLSVEALNNRLNYLEVFDPEGMKRRLEEKSLDNFIRVIEDALTGIGYGPDDLGYLAILHMKRSAHLEILRRLNLPESRSVYLEDYGHMGQNDQILSLELGLASGRVREGDVVAFASAGIGYAWASCVIEWGPVDLFKIRRQTQENLLEVAS